MNHRDRSIGSLAKIAQKTRPLELLLKNVVFCFMNFIVNIVTE